MDAFCRSIFLDLSPIKQCARKRAFELSCYSVKWTILRFPLGFIYIVMYEIAVTQCSSTLTAFFFGWCYSYGPQQGPDRQQKKRGERAQAEEKAKGSCSWRPRTKERKPGKRKKPK